MLVVWQQVYVSHPQTVFEEFVAFDVEALLTRALDEHQTRLRAAQLGNARQRAHRKENFLGKTVTARLVAGGLAYFTALVQRHHAKWRAGFETLANHVEVAHLKNLQRQVAGRKQHCAQREQGQRLEGKRVGHGRCVGSVGGNDPTKFRCLPTGGFRTFTGKAAQASRCAL